MSEIRRELNRKAIHFTGLLYILPTYFGAEILFLTAILSLIFSLLIEYLRRRFRLFTWAVRGYEETGLPAYIFFALSISILSVLVLLGILVMDSFRIAIILSILGDGVGGIVKRFASRNLGSISMFLSALPAMHVLGILNLQAILSALLCTAVERIDRISLGERSFYVEDNFSIPLCAAVSYTLLQSSPF